MCLFVVCLFRILNGNCPEELDAQLGQYRALGEKVICSMKPDADPLTPQERKVIELVALGKTDREIANELDLSYSTVKHYVRSICQKLKVPNRTAAAVKYYRCPGRSS